MSGNIASDSDESILKQNEETQRRIAGYKDAAKRFSIASKAKNDAAEKEEALDVVSPGHFWRLLKMLFCCVILCVLQFVIISVFVRVTRPNRLTHIV